MPQAILVTSVGKTLPVNWNIGFCNKNINDNDSTLAHGFARECSGGCWKPARRSGAKAVWSKSNSTSNSNEISPARKIPSTGVDVGVHNRVLFSTCSDLTNQ